MSVPQVSGECMISTMEQAMRQRPDIFATETMLNFNAEQAELSAGLHRISNDFFQAPDENSKLAACFNPYENSKLAELLLTAFWCAAGITYKAINAQIEAKELEEQWA